MRCASPLTIQKHKKKSHRKDSPFLSEERCVIDEDIEKILRAITKRGYEGEVYAVATQSISASSSRRAETSEAHESVGFAVRVLKDGKLGFSFFEDVARASAAIELAIRTATHSPNFSFPSPQRMRHINAYERRITYFDPRDAIQTMRAELRGAHAKLSSGAHISSVYLCNSHGVEVFERYSHVFGYCHVTIGDTTASASEEHWKSVSFERIAQRAYTHAQNMTRAHPVTKKTDVVFSPECVGDFLETFLYPAVNGDRVRRGASFFCGKKNTVVADERLTIMDHPFRGSSPSRVDDEGNPTRRAPIIARGVLANFFYDQKNACAEGPPARAGNGVRRSYKTPPDVGMHALVIERGKEHVNPDECFVIHSFFGEHTANTVTGDFSLTIDVAYDRGEPVKHVTLSDNFFSLLTRIGAVGSRVFTHGSTIAPLVLFRDVSITASR